MPKQEDTFWGSSENKILLQKFLRNFIASENNVFLRYQLVFSTMNDLSCGSCNRNIIESLEMLQQEDIEEADVKIMLHIKHAAMNNYKNVYVISADTDIMVLALYFLQSFMKSDLEVKYNCNENFSINIRF